MATALMSIPRVGDERVVVNGVSWENYEKILSGFDNQAGVHIYYLRRELEILATSPEHEAKKSMIRRLVEHFTFVREIDLRAYGSTTFREKAKEVGAEPDECYVLGREVGTAPDLAIEVVITHGGLDKLAIYHGLGVREVWFYIEGEISIHRLAGKGYRRVQRSKFVPDLDLSLVARYLDRPDQLAALKEFDAAIRE